MSNIIETQINTSGNLRLKLFETLDRLIAGEISLDHVEGVCAVSEQIMDTAKLDFEVAKKAHEIEQQKIEKIDKLKVIIDTSGDTNE